MGSSTESRLEGGENKMGKSIQISRIALGLLHFVFGLNGSFLFIPVPEQAPAGQAFLDAMRDTGYFIYL